MDTHAVVSVTVDLPRFDGFPYLITRVVAGLYHVIVLPAWQTEERYRDLLRTQSLSNRLDTVLVLDAETARAWNATAAAVERTFPPTGGIIVSDRLLPAAGFAQTSDLVARQGRLRRFADARNPGGYLTGDLTKGGRPATPAELRALAGCGPDGAPSGLKRCPRCAQFRGEGLDPSPRLDGLMVKVHCRCDNHNCCARCGGRLADRRLNANYYDEGDGQVRHVPGFCGLSHQCSSTAAGGPSRRSLSQ